MKTNCMSWTAKMVRLAVLLVGLATALDATAKTGAALGGRAGRGRPDPIAQQPPPALNINLDALVAAMR